MGRWVIALIGLAALVAAPSATPQIIVAQTVFHNAGLPSNAITSSNVTCPQGYVAVSAGVSTAAPGVTTLSIRPLGLRTYAFRFGNPATNPHQRVTVAVSCRRIRVRRGTSPYLKLKPLKLKSFQVKPESQKAASLSCPSGTVPAGTGFDLDPARSKVLGRFSGTALSIRRQTQTLHGVALTVRNSGSRARAVALYATCLTVIRPPGASSGRLLVRIVTDTAPIHPGSQAVKHSCPRGWTALATGFALPGSIAIDGSAAIGRAGKWSLTNRGDSSALSDLQLLCGRLSA
jgi:hypothetical protein